MQSQTDTPCHTISTQHTEDKRTASSFLMARRVEEVSLLAHVWECEMPLNRHSWGLTLDGSVTAMVKAL